MRRLPAPPASGSTLRFLLAFVALVALVRPAAADRTIETRLELTLPAGAEAPRVEATIIGGPIVPLDKVRLVDERGASIRASEMRGFKDGHESIAIAFVIGGGEIMMGNSTMITEDDPTHYDGYLSSLKAGLAALDLGHAMPVGSQGMLVTYDTTTSVRVPMGPIAQLAPAVIGTEKDYYSHVGTNLVDGLQVAIDALVKVPATRKILIVIGDGNDTNNEAAARTFVELGDRVKRAQIQIHSLIYKSPLSSDGDVMSILTDDNQTIASRDDLPHAMASIGTRIADRYTVVFPGEQLRWDGHTQELHVELDGNKLERVALFLGEGPQPAVRYNPFRSWWFQLAMGLGAVGVMALVMRRRARAAATD